MTHHHMMLRGTLRGARRPARWGPVLAAALAASALAGTPAASAAGSSAPVSASVGAEAGAGAAAAVPGACAATRAAVGAALDTLVGGDGVPGAAAEFTDPRCGRRTAARGVADLATGRPMRAEDRLRIGSVTKTFTATLVVQLAAEGRIGLDDTVERHLPGLVRGNGHDGGRITVRQLLQHTSGLPDYTEALVGLPVDAWRFRHFEPRELVAIGLTLPRPEKAWSYSTTNSVIAGLLVEKVTGRPFEAELQRRIIGPLGLRDTYWPGDELRIRGPHSRSYYVDHAAPEGAPRIDGTEWNASFGGAGGALVSTPADVDRFFRALLGGRLLPARWLDEMKRTVPADPDRLWPGARYGLGLIASPLECGGWWWGHGGTMPGGHRTLAAVGPGGRSLALALTEVPRTEQAEQDFRAVATAAFCAPVGGGSDATEETS
ncbi:serine hydrolase domain-containing protein [Kitasatospora sp. NPDC058406]|uniref:serine hydrolase domain-containing protein n=1 Tax=Kitasatospora sp. NPDC058406 TaxID=3346483 RepID=UPI00364B4972